MRSLYITLVVLVFLCGIQPAHANSCDPEFFEVIKARSWMEGQREVEVAERIILKADSVLEYSCFDNRVGELALGADSIFSDRVSGPPLFFSPPPNPPGEPYTELSLDEALEELVMFSAAEYIATNFDHTYAGGTYAGPAPELVPCNVMNAVWSFLKCQDFNQDFFRTFQELNSSDPRTVPVPCEDIEARSQLWASALETAYPPPAIPAAFGGMDAVQTYDIYIYDTFRNSGTCSSSAPIFTGVQISALGTTWPDAVCSIPGCFYNGAGGCE